MDSTEWRFGPFLAEAVQESGLSLREIGRRAGASPNRISQLIEGGPGTRTRFETIYKLSRVLGFDADEAAQLAGVVRPKNWHPADAPLDSRWTVDEMLDALRDRFAEVTRQAALDVARPATAAGIRGRSRTITRLAELADQLADIDEDGAALVRGLSDQLNAQLGEED